ncbi:MAG: valine--tRNA ligase [Alphaproteobacteria bacterium]|nr:valine--tRNA ligase [Alphaproteobacteria bacterium]
MLDKKFDPSEVESRHYETWEKSGHFACDPESNAAPFAVMMPPPNVTGSLHMGHALNCTLHDVLVRWRRMRGQDTLWQPGLDHAGIATQMVVERQLDGEGVHRRDLGREEFVKRVWQWKEESGGTIVGQQKRMGSTPDWERSRFTMDEGLSKAVKKVFVTLYREGLIYKDKRLVNWDPKLQTSISDLEVEQIEQKGHMWHVAYEVEGEEARTITVATTRPETMLGDTAIAVHPEDERYTDLIGKMAVLPIVGRLIPIVADEYADPEQGSGAVKITPAHDFNDFEVGKRHDLPMINIFDERARINENAPQEYQGLDRFEARKKILAELEEQEILVKVDKIKHSVPYDEKSKSVIIEPYLTDQWYVDTPTLAKPALEAVRTGKTTFHPKQYENMYFQWMENQLPWCISRQLWWGHQIPAWYDTEGNIYVAASEEEALAEAKDKLGRVDVELTQDPDVLDTWFSSALWPFSTLGWPEKTKELDKYYPGQVLITGFDIITFWVSRMMMMGIHFMGDVPFKDVYIHALVRDSKGQKMSKSKGNVIDPLELIEQYGTDALRFCLCAMAGQGRDVRLSEDRVAGYRNFATKLWNAARFCEMNEALPDAKFDPASAQYALNRWIITQVVETREVIDTALESYRFNDAANAIYQFVWGTFCDWYLEFTKPVLAGDDEGMIKETRQTTGWVLDQILILLNPFMPFITEELYAAIAPRVAGELLLGHDWPEYGDELKAPDSAKEIAQIVDIIGEIRSIRSDMNVPVSAKITLMLEGASADQQDKVAQYRSVISQMARLEKVEFLKKGSEVPKGAIKTVLGEMTLILPIADLIDLDQERARLKKEISKLEKDIAEISKKLGNEKFVSNAPKEVVEEQKSRQAQSQNTKEKLAQALEQLDAA